MKRFTLSLLSLLFCLASFGQSTDLADCRVNDVAMGTSPSWYDDTNGELTIRLAAADEPTVESVRWYIVADELLAPLGESAQPDNAVWSAPYLELTLPIESAEVKARQIRLLEIKLVGDQAPIKVLAVIFPSEQRDRLVKGLFRLSLHVERGLFAADDLMNRYELPYQSVNVGRSLSLNGPDVFLLSNHAGLSVNGAAVVKFAAMSAGAPTWEIKGQEAVYRYFDDLEIVGNAALEMQVLRAISQVSQSTITTTNLPPVRHEEPLF